jgi:hypothetical protein
MLFFIVGIWRTTSFRFDASNLAQENELFEEAAMTLAYR